MTHRTMSERSYHIATLFNKEEGNDLFQDTLNKCLLQL